MRHKERIVSIKRWRISLKNLISHAIPEEFVIFSEKKDICLKKFNTAKLLFFSNKVLYYYMIVIITIVATFIANAILTISNYKTALVTTTQDRIKGLEILRD